MMVLLNLLIMDILFFLQYTLLHLPGSTLRLYCLAPCSRRHRTFQETLP